MVRNYQKVTDKATQITFENGSTVVTIFKRGKEWRAKAKIMSSGFNLGKSGNLEEFIGKFPNRGMAINGAKTWMKNNPNGLTKDSSSSLGFEGGSDSFGFDFGNDDDGGLL